MLKLTDVNTFYGPIQALKNVSLTVNEKEIVSLLGVNACGKSTTMKAVLGIVRPKTGNILYEGQSINALPTAERVRRGIAPVPEAANIRTSFLHWKSSRRSRRTSAKSASYAGVR